MKIEITSQPSEEDDNFVINKTREYNKQFVKSNSLALSIYIRDNNQEIIAGLKGKTFWNWLHIEYLWVNEKHRNNDLGSKIVLAAENEASARGCTGSTVDTFSFQSLDFYKKLGYIQIGSLSGYAGQFNRYYLEKKLSIEQ